MKIMFGTFRYILAVCVVITHVYPMKFQIGIFAVIGFFMISGYVMGHLVSRYRSAGQIQYFYIDRLLRILPQYLLYLLLTQVSLFFIKFWFFSGYFSPDFSLPAFVLNILLIPVNYFFWLPEIEKYLLIPQAWSLGLEEQFYLIFPLIFVSPWFRRISVILSMIVFAIGATEVLAPEIWTYRLLPGVFFIFILGTSLSSYQRNRDKESLSTMSFIYIFTAILFLCMFDRASMEFGHNREILLAILTLFPVLIVLSLMPRRKWDDFIGKASYGIFLNHVLVYNYLQHYELFMQSYERHLVAGTIISTVVAYLSYYLVEIVAEKYRHRIRRNVFSES
ncbi:MAG: acyltransferase [Bdellovibrionaceae bacterium]|nr:acyltransferase [Pseudobdellovibrionaceae bacterium]